MNSSVNRPVRKQKRMPSKGVHHRFFSDWVIVVLLRSEVQASLLYLRIVPGEGGFKLFRTEISFIPGASESEAETSLSLFWHK
jgi:hypothetical protein